MWKFYYFSFDFLFTIFYLNFFFNFPNFLFLSRNFCLCFKHPLKSLAGKKCRKALDKDPSSNIFRFLCVAFFFISHRIDNMLRWKSKDNFLSSSLAVVKKNVKWILFQMKILFFETNWLILSCVFVDSEVTCENSSFIPYFLVLKHNSCLLSNINQIKNITTMFSLSLNVKSTEISVSQLFFFADLKGNFSSSFSSTFSSRENRMEMIKEENSQIYLFMPLSQLMLKRVQIRRIMLRYIFHNFPFPSRTCVSVCARLSFHIIFFFIHKSGKCSHSANHQEQQGEKEREKWTQNNFGNHWQFLIFARKKISFRKEFFFYILEWLKSVTDLPYGRKRDHFASTFFTIFNIFFISFDTHPINSRQQLPVYFTFHAHTYTQTITK